MPDLIPFDELKSSVAISRVVGETLQLKRVGHEYQALCPFHAERTPSFTVNDEKRMFHCFGCGAHGDVFDWLEKDRGMDKEAAATHLGHVAAKNGTPLDKGWFPAPRPPEGSSEPDLSGFDHIYRYNDPGGTTVRYIARKDAVNDRRKTFTPFTWGSLDGKEGWHARHAATPRQLYRQEDVDAQPNALVVVCEGEKAADAARAILGLPCVTWSGGTQSVHTADWRVLTGRDVVIWPDNDEPGLKATEDLKRHLESAKSVRVLRVSDLPPKADAADLPEGTPETWFYDRLKTPLIGPFNPTPLRDLTQIPPRRWLYGHELIRGFVTILASPGGVGKTAYTVPVGLSVALGRSILAHDQAPPPRHAVVHARGAVWFYNLEDPLVEVDRRIAAALLHHRIDQAELAGWLYTDSARETPLCIGKRGKSGDLEVWPDTDALAAVLRDRGITLLIIDPFVHSHEGKENDNGEMAKMIAEWARVADKADCAVWLVHHFRKGGAGADPDSIRGAVAIVGAVRSAWTVSTMSSEEAQSLGVPEDQRGYYFRHDNAKQNMAPPSAKADWCELISVPLNNGTEEYPDGDHVQAVAAWEPPSAFDNMSVMSVVDVLETLQRGPGNGEQYYLTGGVTGRWAGLVLIAQTGKTEGEAKRIIATWKKSGLIASTRYMSPADRKERGGMSVDALKLAEIRCSTSGDFSE